MAWGLSKTIGDSPRFQSWFRTPGERWAAAHDLYALGGRHISALADLVESQGVRRSKPSAMFESLSDHGFCFIREVNDWDKSVEITPSLWGEEALELFESVLTMTKKKKPDQELTPLQMDILFSAVRIARDDRVQSVKVLKERLQKIWPTKPKSIKVALTYWANYEATKPGARRGL